MNPLRTLLRPFERLHASLGDPARADRTAAGVIAGVMLAYTAFAVLSTAHTNVHWDVGELVAWSREPAWGYKHPPMSAWIAALWFTGFPLADWAAYLLAMTVSGSAIWIAWRLMGEWLDPERRVLGLAMLLLVPLYTFHAIKFNANTVMMPFWAAAVLFFLRSFRTHRRRDAAAAGLAGAGAMLGKYWSVNLVGGLGLAALADRRRGAYFASAAPWITLAVAIAAFLPHLLWIRSSGSAALEFAAGIQHAESASRIRSVSYVAGCIGYVVVPLLLLAALRPSRAALRDLLRPVDADRALAVRALCIPLLLPPLLNLLVPTRLTAVWTIPNWTLLPVVLLSSPLLHVPRRVTTAAITIALAIPLLAVLAAPAIASSAHARGGRLPQSHFEQLGHAAARMWNGQTRAPLRTFGGHVDVTFGAAFYAPGRPLVVRRMDAATVDSVRTIREGIVVLCPVAAEECLGALDAAHARFGGARASLALTRMHRGRPGRSATYVILAIPPR